MLRFPFHYKFQFVPVFYHHFSLQARSSEWVTQSVTKKNEWDPDGGRRSTSPKVHTGWAAHRKSARAHSESPLRMPVPENSVWHEILERRQSRLKTPSPSHANNQLTGYMHLPEHLIYFPRFIIHYVRNGIFIKSRFHSRCATIILYSSKMIWSLRISLKRED